MIVVGFDGAPSGEDALSLGCLFSSLTGEAVAAVVVVPLDAVAITRHADPQFTRLATHGKQAAELAQRLLQERKVPFEVRWLAARSPARGLDEVVRSVPTSTVVIGSTTRGAVGRVLAGTTGERLLHGSPAGVAVAPKGYRHRAARAPSSIAVAYLDPDDSQPALVVGADLARRHAIRLRVLTVVAPPESRPPLPAIEAAKVYDATRRESFQRELEFALAGLHPDIEVQGEVLESYHAVEALAGLADVDLLVCASRGYGPVRRVLLGDVSGALVRGAACPVLIVPRGDD